MLVTFPEVHVLFSLIEWRLLELGRFGYYFDCSGCAQYLMLLIALGFRLYLLILWQVQITGTVIRGLANTWVPHECCLMSWPVNAHVVTSRQ